MLILLKVEVPHYTSQEESCFRTISFTDFNYIERAYQEVVRKLRRSTPLEFTPSLDTHITFELESGQVLETKLCVYNSIKNEAFQYIVDNFPEDELRKFLKTYIKL